ncbi:MAG: hypothetical protein ACQKBT_00910 [Puniceicoccales bacterium]
MPLTEFQKRVLALLTGNRSEESHLAGATGLGLSPESSRYSYDLDYFHDTEEAVAEAFALDRASLEASGIDVKGLVAQPGFIRALVSDSGNELRVEWAHDSAWRFMPPVKVEGIGFVLHPVDLAINKVLALSGRDEPRDLIDTLFVHEHILSLGALVWAAAGKDAGLNPAMLIELLQRKGKLREEDLRQMDMDTVPDLAELRFAWREALAAAKSFVESRSPEEAGCLYVDPESGRFIAPKKDQEVELHEATEGGVLPFVEGFDCDRPDEMTSRFFALRSPGSQKI